LATVMEKAFAQLALESGEELWGGVESFRWLYGLI
jgi:hypothetical protein